MTCSLLELYDIAERSNIDVDCFSLHKRESLAIQGEDGNCHIAIDPFQLSSEADERVKLGHELGHCKQGAFYNRWAVCDVRKKRENTADKWSIHRLVPVDDLDDAVANGYTEIWSLAEYFNVTEDFMRKALCWYVHGNLATNLYF